MFDEKIVPLIVASAPFLGPMLVSLGSIFLIYLILKSKKKKSSPSAKNI